MTGSIPVTGTKLKSIIMCKYNSNNYDWCVEHCPDSDWFLCPEKPILRNSKNVRYFNIAFFSYLAIIISIIVLTIIL